MNDDQSNSNSKNFKESNSDNKNTNDKNMIKNHKELKDSSSFQDYSDSPNLISESLNDQLTEINLLFQKIKKLPNLKLKKEKILKKIKNENQKDKINLKNLKNIKLELKNIKNKIKEYKLEFKIQKDENDNLFKIDKQILIAGENQKFRVESEIRKMLEFDVFEELENNEIIFGLENKKNEENLKNEKHEENPKSEKNEENKKSEENLKNEKNEKNEENEKSEKYEENEKHEENENQQKSENQEKNENNCILNRIKFYEDSENFYIQIKSTENSNKITKNNFKDAKKNIFKTKSYFSHYLYKILLLKLKNENEIKIFNLFFEKKNQNLKSKIIFNFLKEIVKKKKIEIKNIGEMRISLNIYFFVKLFFKIFEKNENIESEKNKESILESDDQYFKIINNLIVKIFEIKISESLFEKILNFSDILYFTSEIKKDKKNQKNLRIILNHLEEIKENIFHQIFNLDFSFKNDEELQTINQIIFIFKNQVNFIFFNHFNKTLKSFLEDTIFNKFINFIKNKKSISEYDSFELSHKSNLLFKFGIERFKNFSRIFVMRRNEGEIEAEDFECIMNKLEY